MSISNPQNLYSDIIRYNSARWIVKRLNVERKYLEDNYNTVNSLKAAFTNYRNYLRERIHSDIIVDDINLLDTCLKIIVLTPEQQKEFIKGKNDNVKSDKSNLRLIYDVEKYINKNIQLLDSAYLYDNLLGLAGLTGRRIAEIACTAEFTKIDTYKALFDGQLKTKFRDDVLPYEIPLLCDYDLINKSLIKVRELRPEFINEIRLFHDNCSSALSKKTKIIYNGLFDGTPKTKDLRAIYALICFTEFNKIPENKRIDRDVYFSLILGHHNEDITTCGSYVDFYVL